jgi:hypothetical protein
VAEVDGGSDLLAGAIKWGGWGTALGFVGIVVVLAVKFRAAYRRTHSKLAALREVLQLVQDGNLLAPEPQPEEQQEEELQQGQDQNQVVVVAVAAGGDHYSEVVLELKDVQQQHHKDEQQFQQHHQQDCLLDFE